MIDRNPNKKRLREKNKKNRVLVPFNTGTRTHKSKRDYDRKKFKKIEKDYWQINRNMLKYNQKETGGQKNDELWRDGSYDCRRSVWYFPRRELSSLWDFPWGVLRGLPRGAGGLKPPEGVQKKVDK